MSSETDLNELSSTNRRGNRTLQRKEDDMKLFSAPVVVSCLTLLLTSCSSQNTDVAATCVDATVNKTSEATDDDEFDGSWEWVSTCGGIGGICHTPGSTGRTAALVLNDSEFAYCEDNTVVASGIFTIIESSPEDEIRYTTDSPTWPDRHFIYTPAEDELVLDEGCCDQFAMSFARID